MSQDATQNERTKLKPILRRFDQACVGSVVFVSLLVIGVYTSRLVSRSGGVIEIDRAEPRVFEFQVDVNAAEWPEIMMLPDVGETLARRIVESRELQGPFLAHEDLLRIKDVGPKTLQRIKPYLLPIPDATSVAESTAPNR